MVYVQLYNTNINTSWHKSRLSKRPVRKKMLYSVQNHFARRIDKNNTNIFVTYFISFFARVRHDSTHKKKGHIESKPSNDDTTSTDGK